MRDKFHPIAALRLTARGLFPVLMLAFVLSGAAISSPAHEQPATGEAPLPRSALPGTPDRPVPCFDRHHHHCALAAVAAVHAEPIFLGLAERASFVIPHAIVPVAAPDVAPHVATSLSILFRNFRE